MRRFFVFEAAVFGPGVRSLDPRFKSRQLLVEPVDFRLLPQNDGVQLIQIVLQVRDNRFQIDDSGLVRLVGRHRDCSVEKKE